VGSIVGEKCITVGQTDLSPPKIINKIISNVLELGLLLPQGKLKKLLARTKKSLDLNHTGQTSYP
jgi:hypothetical protein